jgi:hypothetical protein
MLAAGVQHGLDLGVAPDLGERLEVEALAERVEQLDVLAAALERDHDLDEAEQRAVAALRNELRVDSEATGSSSARCDLGGRHRLD